MFQVWCGKWRKEIKNEEKSDAFRSTDYDLEFHTHAHAKDDS